MNHSSSMLSPKVVLPNKWGGQSLVSKKMQENPNQSQQKRKCPLQKKITSFKTGHKHDSNTEYILRLQNINS